MADFAGAGFLALIVGSAAIGAGRKILERRRARRELRRPSPLGPASAAAPEGATLRATGIARLPADAFALTAPLSNRECLVVRSRVTAGKGFTALAARPRESIAMIPFILDRGEAGEILVEGVHVLLDLPPLALKRDEIDPLRRQRFAAMHGVGYRDHGRARFEEVIVAPGDRISVVGLVMKDMAEAPPTDERGFRDELPTRLRIAGNVDHPLVIGSPVE